MLRLEGFTLDLKRISRDIDGGQLGVRIFLIALGGNVNAFRHGIGFHIQLEVVLPYISQSDA